MDTRLENFRNALCKIAAMDYSNAAVNCCAHDAVETARSALAQHWHEIDEKPFAWACTYQGHTSFTQDEQMGEVGWPSLGASVQRLYVKRV